MPKRTTSARPPRVDSRPRNKLLASLPQAEFDRLRPHLRILPVKAKQIFHSMDEPIQDIIFPNGGVASITMM